MAFVKKKSLGQNFLKDPRALQKIVDASDIKNGGHVLEIGPGEGSLTSLLIEKGAKIMAVEKDDRLIPYLQKKFDSEISSGQLTLVHEDVLSFSPNAYGLKRRGYSIVANIPYYITGEIIKLALSVWPKPKKTVLLIQKEVAERIMERDGKGSILSMSVKFYGQAKIFGIVRAGAFSPSPKVDSAILVINSSLDETVNKALESSFFKVVKTGFAHKRKIISANLKPLFGKNILDVLKKCDINPQSRAETIPFEKWLCLALKYHPAPA